MVSYNAGGGSGKSVEFPKGRLAGPYGKGGLFHKLAELGIGHSDKHIYWRNGATIETVDKLVKSGKLHSTESLGPPRNMCIIVEESHGLNGAFTSKSRIMKQLYAILMAAEDCKILYLSATPVNNNPYELTTLYNVLRGPLGPSGKPSLFIDDPNEGYNKFIEYFINDSVSGPKNEYYFQKRMLGLHSKFRGMKDDPNRIIYPERVDHPLEDEEGYSENERHICNVEMSEYQTNIHDEFLADELEKELRSRKTGSIPNTLKNPKISSTLSVPSKQAVVNKAYKDMMNISGSTFRINSRQACNYVFPAEVVRPRKVNSQGSIPYRHIQPFHFDFEQLRAHIDMLEEKFPEFIMNYKLIVKSNPGDDDMLNSHLTNYIFSSEKYKNGFLEKDTEIWSLLTEEDRYYYIQSSLLDYDSRVISSFKFLNRRAKKYFSDDMMKRCGAKIFKMYEEIMTGEGSLQIVDGPMPSDEMSGNNYSVDLLNADESAKLDEGGDLVDNTEDSTVNPDADENISLPTFEAVISDDYVNVKNYQEDSALAKQNKHVVGGAAVIYSFFRAVEGAGITSRFLQSRGFEEYKDQDDDIDIATIPMAPRFAMITGGGNMKLREAIMKIFKHPRNRHGQLIQILFVTQAAAQGISLFNVRQMHVMEPYWGNNIIRQVIGRIIRLCSHRNLPFDQRIVHIWRYHAVRHTRLGTSHKTARLPSDTLSPDHESATTDKYVQAIADKKDILIFGFNKFTDGAAVDCKLNHPQNSDESNEIICLTFPGDVTVDSKAYAINIAEDFGGRDPPPKMRTVVSKRLTVNYVSPSGERREFIANPTGDEEMVKVRVGSAIREVAAKRVYDMIIASTVNKMFHVGYMYEGRFIPRKFSNALLRAGIYDQKSYQNWITANQSKVGTTDYTKIQSDMKIITDLINNL